MKGTRHRWSWTMGMPSLAFVGDEVILSYWFGIDGHGHVAGCLDLAVKVKVLNVGWFYSPQ